MWIWSLGQEDSLEKQKPTPVFLPGKSHGQRSLAGVAKELDTNEWLKYLLQGASQVTVVVKNLPANAEVRDVGLIPGLGRSPGGGHDNPFQYSCLENPMDRGAWWAIVHRVAKSQTCSHNLLQKYLQTKPLCSVLCRNPGFLKVHVLPRISRSQMWKNVQIMGCLRGQFYPIQLISFLINPNNLPIPFTIHFPVVVV